jgi:hypothetical protein
LKLIATKLQNTTQSLITISSKSIAIEQLTKQKHYLHKQFEREITKKKPLQK